MKRYEITRRGEPFVAGADELVGAYLTWQQALRFMASGDMNIDYALASLDYKRAYSFHDENGHLYWLREHTVDERPNGD